MTEETKEKFKLNPKNKKLIIIVACIFVVAAIATTIIIVLSHRETVGDILDLGDRYMSEMDYESAIREYKRAIEIDPKSEDAYLKLADAYIAIGDIDSAIETLEDGYEATQSERILERLNELRNELHTPEHAKELAVATEPDKQTYYVGETLDLTGLTFIVTYDDGTTEEISEGYAYDVKTLEEPGKIEVTVKYGGAKATVYITVVEDPGTETEPSETEPSEKEPSTTESSSTETTEQDPPVTGIPESAELTGISIKTQPTKTEYYVGEKLDTSGLTLTATYSDGKTETVTNGFACSPTELNTAGTQKITVTYGDQTAAFDVTVKSKEPTLAEDFTWTLENGVLTLSGHGLMPDYEFYDEWYDHTTAPWNGRRYEIEKIIINDGILNIGDRAFVDCSCLTAITIPDGVTSIGERAFYFCTNLTSITIPDSVTSIGSEAFADCVALTSITIPDKVTNIGEDTFFYCINLTDVKIPKGIKTIGDYAFEYCSKLATITIPDSVTSIGVNAFACCDSLTGIDIPSGVKYIGECAFTDCYSLTSIIIPESVTYIGGGTFGGCENLINIYIENKLCTIDDKISEDSEFIQEIGKSTLGNPNITVVHGYTNSTAESYAQKYGYSFISIS